MALGRFCIPLWAVVCIPFQKAHMWWIELRWENLQQLFAKGTCVILVGAVHCSKHFIDSYIRWACHWLAERQVSITLPALNSNLHAWQTFLGNYVDLCLQHPSQLNFTGQKLGWALQSRVVQAVVPGLACHGGCWAPVKAGTSIWWWQWWGVGPWACTSSSHEWWTSLLL